MKDAQIERLSRWAGFISDIAEFGAWDLLAAYRKYYADLLRKVRAKALTAPRKVKRAHTNLLAPAPW